MRSIVEPIYLDLYQKDLEKEKKKEIKKIPTKVAKVTQVINLPKKEKVDKQIKNKRLGKIRKKWWQGGKGKDKGDPKPGNEPGKPTEGKNGGSGEEEAKKKFEKRISAI